jgi:anaerobic selenocysteine-containing dehydrogenase
VAILESFCRICNNNCSIKVTVEGGRATKVAGNRENPVYRGYTCVKGRSQVEYLRSEARLLHSLKADGRGGFKAIPVSDAMDEIAESLTKVIGQYGPRAVAAYAGTMALAYMPTAMPMFNSLLKAIGTPMRFDPNTLDKGGKQVAGSFLGTWCAPSQGFDRPGAILLIGINPLVTYTGLPAGSPHTWLEENLAKGCQLIVIDPRETEVARKASLHIQPAPGHDTQILAAMINVILAEELYDHEFVDRYVRNVPALKAVVDGFSAGLVAEQASIPAQEIVQAARAYAGAPRGYAMAGTGPNFSGGGTLVEYMVSVLETLCGRWLREGEVVRQGPTILPGSFAPRAGAIDPESWGLTELMRVRNLRQTRAGMPTAALADEILTPGDGQVRAFISWAGNPAVAFPDQSKTIAALRSLELLVSVEPAMSETARHAGYVIATKMPLEVASTTALLDSAALRATGYGISDAYAQYSPAVSMVPEGSDLIEDWELFYGLMDRMGYDIEVIPIAASAAVAPVHLESKPSTDELLRLVSAGSRIPLSVVQSRPGGGLFPEGLTVVEPATATETGRLDVGSSEMMSALARQRDSILTSNSDREFGFRLLCRRHNHTYNSSFNVEATNRGVPYNPAFMHPEDLRELGVDEGQLIRIRSSIAEVPAIAAADVRLRRGVVSMAFGYGPAGPDETDVRRTGSSPSRLIPDDDLFDPYTGQPRMSNVPVSVEPFGVSGTSL